jgi:15-cis-phytoene synthase
MSTPGLLDDSMVNRAAPAGSMRYFSLLYAPEEKRDVIMAMYVIDAEIRESAQSVNHDVAHTRLQWWRGEVDRLINGNPQHPATRTLHEHAAVDSLSYAKLHELLAAADMDLARMTYANLRELRAYCSRSGGATQELIAAQLAGPEPLDDAHRASANRLGIGIRLSEIVRDLRQDAYDGRIYLPLDHLDQHELEQDDLRAREIHPRLRQALASFRDSIRADLDTSTGQPHASRLRPILVLAALHRRLLDRIAARNYDVAAERIELGPIEKPWIAWRAARKAT